MLFFLQKMYQDNMGGVICTRARTYAVRTSSANIKNVKRICVFWDQLVTYEFFTCRFGG